MSRLIRSPKIVSQEVETPMIVAPGGTKFEDESLCEEENVNISFFDDSFWDLWLQKVFRNFASMKFQMLLLVYIPVVWGMFHLNPTTNEPWVSEAAGLAFLGGGFITLATSRIVAKTRLTETKDKEFNTDT